METTTPTPSSDLSLPWVLRRPAASRDRALGASVHHLFDAGARAFPTLDVGFEIFADYLAARTPRGEVSLARASDLYLACACATRVRGAVEAFERTHLQAVGGYLARMRPSEAFVDELRQSLREKLFVSRNGSPPKIAEYDGRGALASWVRVVALRAAINLRQRTPRGVDETAPEREDPAAGDPETGYLKQRYRSAFTAAFRGAVAALGRDQRDLLRLHFVDGLTLDQLAAKTGVHRATVARRIAAAREAVAEDARRRLRDALGATDAELASLAGVMRSQIELSLPGLL